MNTPQPDSHISIVSFHDDSLERIAAMSAEEAHMTYNFLSGKPISIVGKMFQFSQDTIDKVRAYYVANVALPEKAMREIIEHQHSIENERRPIPRSHIIAGNVRYYFGKIW